ncbi:hypothetical protein A6F68_00706 [Tsuneonella dongtanensis]|uniref:Uncharacterized protein n=1 Tax=Tsuneonella dongtanensis TaxID=692370 RepID=A0A1B2AB17_9SPHN|nr:hypothetical protein [Tsuneonella dongtanensis]ANY19235.1 hypothetical protein A6F68_00706 [Tsuneonella dongtanensis]
MRLIATAAALAAAALAAGPSVAAERLTGEAKLAKMLEGRVAGEPRSCINTFTNRESTVIDETAVVYGRGRTIWVNRTANPDDLNRWDALLVRQHGPQLCRQDIVTTFDPSTGMYTGNVFLTDFVPYTRAD